MYYPYSGSEPIPVQQPFPFPNYKRKTRTYVIYADVLVSRKYVVEASNEQNAMKLVQDETVEPEEENVSVSPVVVSVEEFEE
jgi:hypothetical protein